jgi:NAD(P)-dependent dehydrogenase (short-subunit alcohol dehydrogenase family)
MPSPWATYDNLPHTLLILTDTLLILCSYFTTAEEAAGGIMMLASPWATYITGHTLEVTGGMGM